MFSTTIPLQVQTIPLRAVVQAIYATATNPHTHQPHRVRVEAVRLCGRSTPARYVDVCGLDAILGYSVPVADLRQVSAFVTWE